MQHPDLVAPPSSQPRPSITPTQPSQNDSQERAPQGQQNPILPRPRKFNLLGRAVNVANSSHGSDFGEDDVHPEETPSQKKVLNTKGRSIEQESVEEREELKENENSEESENVENPGDFKDVSQNATSSRSVSCEDEGLSYFTPAAQPAKRRSFMPVERASNIPHLKADEQADPFEGFDVASGSEKEFLVASLEAFSNTQVELQQLKSAQALLHSVHFDMSPITHFDTPMAPGELEEIIVFTRDAYGNLPRPDIKYPAPLPVQQKWVDHFVRCHKFIVNNHIRPTTAQRRAFERDVYDFCRTMEMGRKAAEIQRRKARAAALRSRGLPGAHLLDDTDAESNLGIEIDHIPQVIPLAQESNASRAANGTPTTKRKRGQDNHEIPEAATRAEKRVQLNTTRIVPQMQGRSEEKKKRAKKPAKKAPILTSAKQSGTSRSNISSAMSLQALTTQVPLAETKDDEEILKRVNPSSKPSMAAKDKHQNRRERRRTKDRNTANGDASIPESGNSMTQPAFTDTTSNSKASTQDLSSMRKRQRRGSKRKMQNRQEEDEMNESISRENPVSLMDEGSKQDSVKETATPTTKLSHGQRKTLRRAAKGAKASASQDHGDIIEPMNHPTNESSQLDEASFVDLRAPKKKKRKRASKNGEAENVNALEPKTEREAHENFLKSNADPISHGGSNEMTNKVRIGDVADDDLSKDLKFNQEKLVEDFVHGGDKGMSKEAKAAMKDEAAALGIAKAQDQYQPKEPAATNKNINNPAKGPAQVAQEKREAEILSEEGQAKPLAELGSRNSQTKQKRTRKDRGNKCKMDVQPTARVGDAETLKENHS